MYRYEKNIGYVLYVRTRYVKVDYKHVPDLKAIGKRWNVLIHSIAGIVVNNTDVINFNALWKPKDCKCLWNI